MQIGVLGPLEVTDQGRPVEVPGLRARRLLVRLAVAGQVVSADELVDAVWPDDPPANVANALQSLVSRLRRALSSRDVIQQVSHGYRLAVAPTDIDVNRFARAVAEGTRLLASGDPVEASRLLSEGLALWRGEPLYDAGDARYAGPVVVQWEEQRLHALAARIEADLDTGKGAALVGELESLAAAHPLRERFAALLMRALHADGRTTEALVVYERLRARVADELGSDPSTALQEQHLALLRQAPAKAPRSPGDTNLPTAMTRFVGREDEAARVSQLLGAGRLVTVVGPGGSGKTRLATEVARDWRQRMPDGVWLVELAPVGDDSSLAMAFLGTLGLHEAHVIDVPADRAADPVEQLTERLRAARCLLVVDNCEHLIDGVALLLGRVLSQCPEVRVIATSREPLGIDGEALCVLPPLAMPPTGATVDEALALPAVQLFVDRADSVDADFVLDEASLPSVIEIVRRLDGMPLPIELAAARLRVLPVSEIASRLSDRFRLLTGGSRSAMPRHRTLRAVVEWSWTLLSDQERLLCERLSVFPSGATADSARAVCFDDLLQPGEIPELLDSLVEKSLLKAVDEGGLRYQMLETIREYGIERLGERDEIVAARTAHARHHALLVERVEPTLRTADQLEALATLETERDNVSAALRFLSDSGHADEAVRLSLALSWYWSMLGAHGEAYSWLALSLAVPGWRDDRLHLLGETVLQISSIAVVRDHAREWSSIVSGLRDLDLRLDEWEFEEPLAVVLRPVLAFFSGDETRAKRLAESALRSSDPWVRCAVRTFRVNMAENSGDTALMRADIDAAATDIDAVGDRWLIGSYLSARARLRSIDEDLAGAIDDYQRAGRVLEEIGSHDDGIFIAVQLADLRLRSGDVEGARRDVDRAREHKGSGGLPVDLLCDVMQAAIARYVGDLEEAARLHRALQQGLAELPTQHPVFGHVRAMILAGMAVHEIQLGRLDEAAAALSTAFPVALATSDMPIVAAVGVAGADLLRARGHPVDAAGLLAAAAVLRGSDDATDITVRRVTAALKSQLGEAYPAAIAAGKAVTPEEARARIDAATRNGVAASTT